MLSLPNFDYRRLPALDEHGQMLFETAAGRQSKRKTPGRAPQFESHPKITGGHGEAPRQPEESPNDFPLNDSSPDQPPDWELYIAQPAFIELMTYLGSRAPEAAGVLFEPADDEALIDRFIPDYLGHGTAASFELHTPSLNQMLQELKQAGKTCKGIAHSHPFGITQPSNGDLAYFRRLFSLAANAEATHVFVPIVCGGRLYPYVYTDRGISVAMLVVV